MTEKLASVEKNFSLIPTLQFIKRNEISFDIEGVDAYTGILTIDEYNRMYGKPSGRPRTVVLTPQPWNADYKSKFSSRIIRGDKRFSGHFKGVRAFLNLAHEIQKM